MALTRLLLLCAAVPVFLSASVTAPLDIYTFAAPNVGFGVENDALTWGFTISSLGPLTNQPTYTVELNGSPNPNYAFVGATGTSVTDYGGYDVYGPELTFYNPGNSSQLEFDFLGTAEFWESVTPTPEQLTPAEYGQSTTDSGADWNVAYPDPPCNACYVSLPNDSAVSPEPTSCSLLAAGFALSAVAIRKLRRAGL